MSLTRTETETLSTIHEWMGNVELPDFLPKMKTGMILDRQVKYVSWDFNKVPLTGPLEVLHLTDLQYGHKYFRRNRFIEYRDWVLSSPNRYVVLGGDLPDAAHILSKGSPYENEGDPQSQIYRLVDDMAPLRGRILGYVGGNHERRGLKTFGDLGILIASLLRIPYSNGIQFVDINLGEHKPFKIALHHDGGSKSASTKGAIANVIYKFMQRGDSQLYLLGHLHQAMVIPDWREERDEKSRDIKLVKIFGAMSTSFLKTYGTYGEVAGFRPQDVMMARAIIEPNGKWEVTLR